MIAPYEHPGWLYTAVNADGQPLYIGTTESPKRRILAHRKSPWWEFAAGFTFRRYPDGYTAREAERRLIRQLRPPFNRSSNPDWKKPKGSRHGDPAWGQHLRSLRKRAGLSQVELGARVGLDQGAISRLEKGRRVPNIAQIAHLVAALDCKAVDLLEGMEAA
jgi:DNA-binding XRE family transcriptional regulator